MFKEHRKSKSSKKIFNKRIRFDGIKIRSQYRHRRTLLWTWKHLPEPINVQSQIGITNRVCGESIYNRDVTLRDEYKDYDFESCHDRNNFVNQWEKHLSQHVLYPYDHQENKVIPLALVRQLDRETPGVRSYISLILMLIDVTIKSLNGVND